ADDDRRRPRTGQRIRWLTGCVAGCSADRCACGGRGRGRAGIGPTVVSRPVISAVVAAVIVVVVRVVLPVLAPLVGIFLAVLGCRVALLLALLEILLPLILALSLSLGALVLPGLALLGGAEPRAPLVLPLRRRVAVVLPPISSGSTGSVVARRP